ncbi:MAG TPA: glycogen/starch synthase [Candidatus Limnocylindria bacterium]|nr:glycogen/starch synthase [Candidatus Limnocylindria bacterium]
MRIAFAAAEVAPFMKVGGLADVAGSLPQALAAAGHEVTVYMPLHLGIDRAKHGIPEDGELRSVAYGRARARVSYPSIQSDGVRTVFVRSDKRIGRDKAYGYPDDNKRYAFWCRAVAEHIAAGPAPDVVHAHDWHAGLLMQLICDDAPTVFTIHNLAYQGKTSIDVMDVIGLRRTRLIAEQRGELNPMARGIINADVVSTVSERYAQEILTPEFGEGLQDLLRERKRDLFGIVNGIDTRLFDPATDRHIAATYSASDPSPKAANKAALQKEAGLAVDPKAPLVGMVGRLVEQKGIDILTAAAPGIFAAGAQMVVLGAGDASYEEKWKRFAREHKGRLHLVLGFDAALAQRIYAGTDMFVMPSRFEPCGLGQLISFRYGTVPVVHSVGGLRDTVRDADAERGNGFSFEPYTADALLETVKRAIRAYRDAPRWDALRARGMREDHSWGASAKKYEQLYATAKTRHKKH